MPRLLVDHIIARRRTLYAWIGIGIVLSSGAGCGGGDPNAGRFTREKPKSGALVGRWTLKKDSLGSVPGRKTDLLLNDNGRFTATNYPAIALDAFGIPGENHNGKGSWSIAAYQWYWVVRLNWDLIDGAPEDIGLMLVILDSPRAYELHEVIDDPDVGRFLAFEKTEKVD